ncbi:hypothetical protein AOQ84DRAFT_356875 [Glonium stellatum]|uniref:Uncharacterized protein n=1 Tax=Glonium stellatum TaxID=574774 RepID=A0A8E2JND2_9PEZI|nr:hypothetical protein AOQ84DRAFT_356875 [Glonium stellatum]
MAVAPRDSVPFSLATLGLQPHAASGDDLRFEAPQRRRGLGPGTSTGRHQQRRLRNSTFPLPTPRARMLFARDEVCAARHACELSRVPASPCPEYRLSPER